MSGALGALLESGEITSALGTGTEPNIEHRSAHPNKTDHHAMQPDSITLVKPSEIINWEFHDRPDTELGNIQELADDMLKNEQHHYRTALNGHGS